MRVVVLGSGVWVGNRGHSRRGPGFLLRAGDRAVLIDCAAGTNYQLAEAGFDPNDLDALFLTHLHADHSGGAIALLGEMVITGRGDRFEIYGPPGTRDFLEGLLEAHSKVPGPIGKIRDSLELAISDARPGPFYDSGGLGASAYELKHAALNYGYRFESDGRSVAFTGDTEPCDALVELARGCDLLLCQCFKMEPSPFHMDPRSVADLCAKASPKRTVLVHLSPELDPAGALGIIRAMWGGEVEIAEDMMVLEA
ncbi:MAG: ribonuclease Z [Candidatus Bathyarchaeia archaeon]